MCLTEHKLEAIIRFQAEDTIHKELWGTGLEYFLFRLQAIEFILFVEYGWCSFVIALLKELGRISKTFHHIKKAKVGLCLAVAFRVDFA